MTKAEEILYSKISGLEQIEINGELEHMIKLSEALEAVNEALILPVVVKSLKEKETIHSAKWTSEDDINLPCKC